ncbi:hypothetical protein ORV05_17650 [Amycolatopsis cynarae]|uniref:Uncharacterized protein n=1 Tax=Amycolatopsis cynarae TaxID=2995223 RepID=A0ABY7BE60_9PSEU|nr:hypothetical protein [Amycolatopsis sp. HUAS 11-8]WAL69517.1 hypothetical protein ORV05_17650 [Amycolatopsis sp. HUAS 11-8]
MLVVEEPLDVLLAAERAEGLAGSGGIRPEALNELDRVGFPRSGSPAWYDEPCGTRARTAATSATW